MILTTRADGHPMLIMTDPVYFHRLTHKLQKRLPMWVVYRPCTIEYPGQWVARMHLALPQPRSTRFVFGHTELEGLRQLLPPWLNVMPRQPGDRPEIVEVWL